MYIKMDPMQRYSNFLVSKWFSFWEFYFFTHIEVWKGAKAGCGHVIISEVQSSTFLHKKKKSKTIFWSLLTGSLTP